MFLIDIDLLRAVIFCLWFRLNDETYFEMIRGSTEAGDKVAQMKYCQISIPYFHF